MPERPIDNTLPGGSRAAADESRPSLPTGTITFLFTDIEGSTPMWERDALAMQAAVARHHAILHQAAAQHGGHVFKIVGDEFQIAYELPARALQAALAAQRALRDEPWGATGPLRLRRASWARWRRPWKRFSNHCMLSPKKWNMNASPVRCMPFWMRLPSRLPGEKGAGYLWSRPWKRRWHFAAPGKRLNCIAKYTDT
jgi:hypothetical protein